MRKDHLLTSCSLVRLGNELTITQLDCEVCEEVTT
jgi:hypothetical protein